MAKEVPLEVEIIERRELKLPGPTGEMESEWWITYRHGRLPPGLIRIKGAEYTPEKEKAMIKEDIKTRLAQRPSTLKV
jgi:hypothetical protein